MNDLNPRVRVHVLRMLQLASMQIGGNWRQRGDRLLRGAAELDAQAPWWVHRRRLDLRLALEMLSRPQHADGCWVTRGARGKDGRGVRTPRITGTRTLSRQVFIHTSGRYDLPTDVHVRHACGCGADGCGSPWHLIPGSHADNARDRFVLRRGGTLPRRATSELVQMDVLDRPLEELRILASWEHHLSRLRRVDGCIAIDGALHLPHYRALHLPGEPDRYLHRTIKSYVLGHRVRGLVLHSCDVKQCVDTRHTRELGTRAQNIQEAKLRRRYPTGVNHPRSGVTPQTAPLMVEMLEEGRSTRAVANALGLTLRVVQHQQVNATYGGSPRPTRPKLSDRGVVVVRTVAAVGADQQLQAGSLGLSADYLHGLATHRQRPGAGGPRKPDRGRASGARVGNGRVDQLLKAEIRQRLGRGEQTTSIAADLGLHDTTVRRAMRPQQRRG